MNDHEIIWKQRYTMADFKGKSQLLVISIIMFLMGCCIFVMFWTTNTDSSVIAKWLIFAGGVIIMQVFPFINYIMDKREFAKLTKSTYEFCTCCNHYNHYTGNVRSEAVTKIVKDWNQD